MELNLAPNPLHNARQRLSFDKVATLIGGIQNMYNFIVGKLV